MGEKISVNREGLMAWLRSEWSLSEERFRYACGRLGIVGEVVDASSAFGSGPTYQDAMRTAGHDISIRESE